MKMEEVRKKIEKLKRDYEASVSSNESVSIKMGILKEIILLYDDLKLEMDKNCKNREISQIKKEEAKYFDLYCIYQEGRVLVDRFYFLLKELVNIRKMKYDILEFCFDCCYDNLPHVESKYLILIEKNQLKELEEIHNLTCDEFKNRLFQYFKDGGEGLVFSDTHCLNFEFNFDELNERMIDTVDGNPIYFIQDVKNSFFGVCVEEGLNYIQDKGFDYSVSSVGKMKRKLYSNITKY